jgi:hypothetical protein
LSTNKGDLALFLLPDQRTTYQGEQALSDDLATLIARKFVHRADVRAEQVADGGYRPIRTPWRKEHFDQHLSGEHTFGHYVVGLDGMCKVIVFDIDLIKVRPPVRGPGWYPLNWTSTQEELVWEECDPRLVWRDRAHPARAFFKCEFRMMAERIAAVASRDMGMQVAVAYSGSKGVHVYCWDTSLLKASDARIGAGLILDQAGDFELYRGSCNFRTTDQTVNGSPNLTIEVFPKQDSLDDKDLGNLVRLPLGVNRHAPDPTFFIDLRAPMNELVPVDPMWALTTSNPWADA